MKTVITILLVILLATPVLAASTCDNNKEKASKLYVEAGDLVDEGNSYYKQYFDALNELPQGAGPALKFLNLAIEKARATKDKLLLGQRYIEKAQGACYDTDLLVANVIAETIGSAIKDVNKKLSTREVNDRSLVWTDYYVFEKYERLRVFIREKKTNAAIYWIENGNVDLNYRPESLDPLLIIAAKDGAVDIVKSLLAHGADIDIAKDDYTALEIAGIRGDYAMFSYLFNKKASPFLLKGFKQKPLYRQCNFVDMVSLSASGENMVGKLNLVNEHDQILAFLNKQGMAQVCSRVVATVNGNEVKQGDVNLVFAATVLPQFQAENPGQEVPVKFKQEAQGEILDHIITLEVLNQAATQANISPDKRLAQQQLSKVAWQLPPGLYSGHEKQIIDYLTREIVAQQLINKEVMPNIQITEQELRQFYDNNQDNFSTPDQVRVLNLLTKTREQAEQILVLAKQQGSDFAELARKYSTGSAAKQGGDLGFFARGKMVKSFEDEAFSLKQGEISSIVQTEFGFHIIKLVDRKKGGVTPFVEVKDRLEQWMRSQGGGEAVKKWIDELRAQATIVIK